MGSDVIKQDISQFQAAVSRLSSGVNQAGALWRDEHFAELYHAVCKLANSSKHMVMKADVYCAAIDSFHKVSAEKY